MTLMADTTETTSQLDKEIASLQRRVQELESSFFDHSQEAIESHRDVVRQMAGFVEEQLVWLPPVQDSWQPSDILPDLTTG